MKKIRINELARELEVKPGVIIDMLPELGVSEKKTHSSSIDEDVAIVLKQRLFGSDVPRERTNGHVADADYEEADSAEFDNTGRPSEEGLEPVIVAEPPRPARPSFQPPLRSPGAGSSRPNAPAGPRALPIPPAIETPRATAASKTEAAVATPAFQVPPSGSPARTQPSEAFGPHAPVPPQPVSPQPGSPPPGSPLPGSPLPSLSAPPLTSSPEGTPAASVAVEPERPALRFQPLRPPLGAGSGIAPPIAPPPAAPAPSTHSVPPSAAPGHPSKPLPIPARPLPPSAPRVAPTRPGIAVPTVPLGPRQPLPNEPIRSGQAPPPPSRRFNPPAPGAPTMPQPPPAVVSNPTSQPPSTQVPPPAVVRPQQVPTHVVAPGPTQSASAVPGSPIPPRPANPRPTLVPGAPIAPRPTNPRPPLAGQPAARPIVPPRPDLVQRLRQQQTPPPQPRPPMTATPATPRPGAPARPATSAPGQPLYRGPIRPGQPLMRGPGSPAGPGPGPGSVGTGFPPGFRRPGGGRPPHPTSLRPEVATMPAEQQRRHQAKPAGRPTARKREQEGNIRERVSKRSTAMEPPPIDREITVAEGVTVKELSEKLGVKANLVIKKLVEKKIFATINQTLDVKLAEELAREFGASTNQVSYEEESTQDLELAEEEKDFVRRAPVVTIMGHVDHGKTSLLDAIRETNVAGREAGGITQHIGAYHVEKNGRKIVFIDTPGHQAFTRMRARGAKVTDIVVLVVSADDGVMPQTLEAIDHARAAKVPMIVAINKIDKPGAQPDRVKQQLSDRGLLAEDWGGDVVMTPVSAKTGQNLDLLLEMILLVADIQDLKANPNRPALGTVLEAKLDKGRGPVATMLVRNGTFKVGEYFICGSLFSKVRAMFDDRGNSVKEAEPSMPVEVIGLESLPEVGDSFQVVSDTSKAKQIVIYREAKARDVAMAKGARVATLDSLRQQFKEGELKDLNVIIKADVGGTAEVLSDTLQALSNDKVRIRVLRAGVGAITEDDVLLGSASEALIVGFNVRPERSAQAVADQQKVDIRLHSIIYELIDEIKLAMTGMLEPVFKETVQGHAEVKETFRISKVGTVAGCYVSDGFIRRDSQVRVIRDRDVVHTGRIEALKRFKNDASEVKNGVECGISLVNFNNIQAGDILEMFSMERIAAELPVASR